MKLTLISDTHGQHDRVEIPRCDVLIHSGDFTAFDTDAEWGDFVSWILEQPAEHILLIQGNHDNLKWVEAGQYLGTNLTLLHDTEITIDGVKFYGSPWTPEFFDWHWMLPRNSTELEQKWDAIPDDTDVLITHGPPMGILDVARGMNSGADVHCGCELLESRVKGLKQLKLQCFGHIHESHGQAYNGKYVNASIMDGRMRASNSPVVIELDDLT